MEESKLLPRRSCFQEKQAWANIVFCISNFFRNRLLLKGGFDSLNHGTLFVSRHRIFYRARVKLYHNTQSMQISMHIMKLDVVNNMMSVRV